MILPGVDFSLPEDHADTAAGLAAGSGTGRLEVRAGGHHVDHSPLARERVSRQGAATDVARALRGGLRDH